MMTIFIVSIGFNITHVGAKLERIGLTTDDRIIFVRPKTDPNRDKSLLRKVRETEDAIKLCFRKYDYTIIDIDDADINGSMGKIIEATWNDTEKYTGQIILLISGGTRSQVSILTLYGQIDPRISKTFVYSENVSKYVEAPIFNPIKNLTKKKIERNLEELKHIYRNKEGKDGRLARKLKEQGLARKLPGGRNRYELTDLGKVYLKAYEIALKVL